MVVHRRPGHREQDARRPHGLGPDAQGRLPALQGAARVRPALPERVRLPGALDRGRGRAPARAQLEARDRGVRPRGVRAPLPRGRRPVVGGADARLQAPRPVDGLGQRLLHLQRHEHRVHLALPEDRPRARLALRRPPLDRVVPALRHVALPARADAVGRLPGAKSDPSLFVRFPLLDRPGESVVVWTTTPWTLPANVAAAVNPEAEYGLRENGEWVLGRALSRTSASSRARPGRGARRPALPRAVRRPRARRVGRAPRRAVGRGLARGGHGHRPHRDRLRRRGLRARPRRSACRC